MSPQSDLTFWQEKVAFHHALGKAIARWAGIELFLLGITQRIMRPKEAIVLAMSYYAIENFRSKLAFVDRQVSYSADDAQHLSAWTEVRDFVRQQSEMRNRLVHGSTIEYHHQAPIGRRIAIVPTVLKPSRHKSNKVLPPSGSLCLRDIDLAEQQFLRAMAKLDCFQATLAGTVSQFALVAQQEPRPRSVAEIAHLIFEVR